MNSGTSLVALGLRLPTCVRGTQVGSLVGELRSCMLSWAGEKKKECGLRSWWIWVHIPAQALRAEWP